MMKLLVTIGEIANELVKYATRLEMSIVGATPILKAYISKLEGPTRVYVYIAQVDDYRYSAYSDIFDIDGARFLPTGNKDKPYIREIDMIHEMFWGSGTVNTEYMTCAENVGYPQIIGFIFDLLLEHDILKVNSLNSRIASLGFNNSKIIRALDKAFNNTINRGGTILDMHRIVVRDRGKFVLNGLRAKDIKCIVDKLADKGVFITINNDRVVDVTFRRK